MDWKILINPLAWLCVGAYLLPFSKVDFHDPASILAGVAAAFAAVGMLLLKPPTA